MTSESLDAIFQNVIWNFCYLSVLLGLSAFGVHRYFIIYLFLKNRRKQSEPAHTFRELPFVTVQLPVFNEYYVIRRLIKAAGSLDYPRERLQIQILDDSLDETRRSLKAKRRSCVPRDWTSSFSIARVGRDSRLERSLPAWKERRVSSSLSSMRISFPRPTLKNAPSITLPTRGLVWFR